MKSCLIWNSFSIVWDPQSTNIMYSKKVAASRNMLQKFNLCTVHSSNNLKTKPVSISLVLNGWTFWVLIASLLYLFCYVLLWIWVEICYFHLRISLCWIVCFKCLIRWEIYHDEDFKSDRINECPQYVNILIIFHLVQ